MTHVTYFAKIFPSHHYHFLQKRIISKENKSRNNVALYRKSWRVNHEICLTARENRNEGTKKRNEEAATETEQLINEQFSRPPSSQEGMCSMRCCC